MAKTIMIQGTASNVGKSLMAAGLCRIFKQDGYRVAPFKSQNMALNSYITRDGLEMGRAQVVQAEAAGIEPHTDMNPILLKPSGDARSQVIVQGEIFGDQDADAYYFHKKAFEPRIRESFERLSRAYDIIVLEGAGSPAEINLKENDIVNMYMARLAKAPVLLVGDIDRGGVFASLAGTLLLFTPEERDFVKAVVINKFRGSRAILEPGLRQIEGLIHKPVLGVIPYIKIDIDDEDSLTERFTAPLREDSPRPLLADIGVIRLPRIANFTDFNVLSRLPGVRLRYVEEPEKLGNPDLIILPGTKNTMGDLLWMVQNGLAVAIREFAARGRPVFGICGGYQMLGRTLDDPQGVEQGGTMEGLGLLPVTTIFAKEKTRTRVRGAFASLGGIFKPLSGMDLEGYEVHMGITRGEADGAGYLADIRYIASGTAGRDGLVRGNVYGSYIHGLFDANGIAEALAGALSGCRGAEGAPAGTEIGWKAYKEKQYDTLAECLRTHLNMERVYQILEEGV
ncbi:MAG: cobyric acid synthase [Spirochaetaceae bacterium]|jgi:adenosylcobyric acid synthase|nr:cobyric acid synthase [Spirochaetaceae bacterium]